MTDKKNKKTTDKPAKASKQAKPVVKAAAKAPAKPAVKAVAAKAPSLKASPAKAAPANNKAAAGKPTSAKTPVAKVVTPKQPIAVTPKPKPVTPNVGPAINEKVQLLVSLSKKNGFVTVQNINEVIPDSATDPELIENIMNIDRKSVV